MTTRRPTLEVIDATLAGEAVEPEHAELAELTLILAGQRPVPSAAFTDALDERVARRFARAAVADSRGVRAGAGCSLRAPRSALAAAVVAVIVVVGRQRLQRPSSASARARRPPSARRQGERRLGREQLRRGVSALGVEPRRVRHAGAAYGQVRPSRPARRRPSRPRLGARGPSPRPATSRPPDRAVGAALAVDASPARSTASPSRCST